jgi:hypothetical protein
VVVDLAEPAPHDGELVQHGVGVAFPIVHAVEQDVVEIGLHPLRAGLLRLPGGVRLLELLNLLLHLRRNRLVRRQLRGRRRCGADHLDPDRLVALDDGRHGARRELLRRNGQHRVLDVGRPVEGVGLLARVFLGGDLQRLFDLGLPLGAGFVVSTVVIHDGEAERGKLVVVQKLGHVAVVLRELEQAVERDGLVPRLFGLGLGSVGRVDHIAP